MPKSTKPKKRVRLSTRDIESILPHELTGDEYEKTIGKHADFFHEQLRAHFAANPEDKSQGLDVELGVENGKPFLDVVHPWDDPLRLPVSIAKLTVAGHLGVTEVTHEQIFRLWRALGIYEKERRTDKPIKRIPLSVKKALYLLYYAQTARVAGAYNDEFEEGMIPQEILYLGITIGRLIEWSQIDSRSLIVATGRKSLSGAVKGGAEKAYTPEENAQLAEEAAKLFHASKAIGLPAKVQSVASHLDIHPDTARARLRVAGVIPPAKTRNTPARKPTKP